MARRATWLALLAGLALRGPGGAWGQDDEGRRPRDMHALAGSGSVPSVPSPAVAPAPAPRGGREGLAAEIAASARDLDWPALLAGPERVVVLGESHDCRAHKRELAELLEDRAAAERLGLTHLALEAFCADEQDALDRLCQRGSAEDEARAAALLAAHMRPAFEPAGYARLALAAQRLNLELVALDMPYAELRRRYDELGARYARRLSEPGLVKRLEVEAEQRAAFAAVADERDAAMADALLRLLDPDGDGRVDTGLKVLAYVGAYHARKEGVARHLRSRGVAARSYAFLDPRASGEGPWPAPFFDAIRGSPLKERKLLFTHPSVSSLYDGVISLPAICQR